jgi:hypothetical protein
MDGPASNARRDTGSVKSQFLFIAAHPRTRLTGS